MARRSVDLCRLAFHGAGLITEHVLAGRIRAPGWVRWFVTFHLIVFSWILFRSDSVAAAGTMLSRLAQPGPATLWSAPVVLAIVVVVGLQLLPAERIEALQVRLERQRPAILGLGLAALILVVGATVSGQGVAPFIYFRF